MINVRNQGVGTKRFSDDNGHWGSLNQNNGDYKFTKEKLYLQGKNRPAGTADPQERIRRAFKKAAKHLSATEVLQELRDNRMCIIPSGSPEHSLAIVFYRERNSCTYCAICNPGYGTPQGAHNIEMFEIRQNNLNDQIIKKLRKITTFSRDPFDYIYRGLKQQIGAPVTADTRPLIGIIQRFSPKDLETNTCCLNSAKCALRYLYAHSAVDWPHPNPYHILQNVQGAFKRWENNLLIRELKSYKESSQYQNPTLIQHAEARLAK